ncbi:MAG: protein kinase [Verrucomicrobiota bacterium]
MFAMIGLSWSEVILMVLAFLVMVVVASGVVLVIWLMRRSEKKPDAPRSEPPIHPTGTVRIKPRSCPQCGATLAADVPEGLCPSCLLQHGIATEGGVPPGTPPFVPPTMAELAQLFPQLEIQELVGKGGMGAVYKARQPSLDRFVALKILAPRSGGDLDFAGRFTREARALARLNHPNIVAVYDFGQAANLSYFIMEFVDGPNLRQAGRIKPQEAMEIIPQICGALQFAHDEGIVHRDIKPENILLDRKGRVKIADFGLAKILGQGDFRLTGAKDIMGTPHYMAPEQVERPQEVDHRADIYSLGVVFYEMLTGELPLGKFQSPSQKVGVDVRLDEVVLRSLAKERELRYQHVSEVGTRVETIADTPAGAANVPPTFPKSADTTKPAGPSFKESLQRGLRAAWRTGLVVCVLVWLVVLAVTLVLPKTYQATARVSWVDVDNKPTPQVDPYHLQTEVENVTSDAVLRSVGKTLKLNERWSRRYMGGEAMTDDAVATMIRGRVQVEPVRNTWLLQIICYSESAVESAEIANQVAEQFCQLSTSDRKLVNRATQPFRPVKPDYPMNFTLGFVGGIGLGLFFGFLGGLVAFIKNYGAITGPGRKMVSDAGREYKTTQTILGWPLVHSVSGIDPATGRPRVARGIVAVGPRAIGVVAVGWEAVGVFSSGLLAAGVCPVGLISVGLLAVGLVTWGWQATGGLAFGLSSATGLFAFGNNAVGWERCTISPGTFAVLCLPLVGLLVWRILAALFRKAVAVASPAPAQPAGDYFWRRFAMAMAAIVLIPIALAVVGVLAALLFPALARPRVRPVEMRPAVVNKLPDQRRPETANDPVYSLITWSPVPTSNGKPDLQAILQEATALREAGRYEEALQRHLWYHEHALEVDRAQLGVRLSFALSDWMELARRYPRAWQALVEVRDLKTNQLLSGRGYSELFQDVAAINGELQQDDSSVQLFKTLETSNPKLADQCYFYIQDELVKRGEYATCVRHLGDAQQRFENIQRTRSVTRNFEDRNAATRKEMTERYRSMAKTNSAFQSLADHYEQSASAPPHADRRFVDQTRQLIEILVGTSRRAEAEEIRDRAIAVVDDSRLKSAVDDAEAAVRKHGVEADPASGRPAATPAGNNP